MGASQDAEDRQVLEVVSREAGQRVDLMVARRLPSLSRSRVEKLAREGQVLVNGRPVRPSHHLQPGDRVEVRMPKPLLRSPPPEAIPISIIYEDDQVLVVNKPPGMVVHPGAGRGRGTLVNALLAHLPTLAAGEDPLRPGIVHRLDRHTSGLMVVAKTDGAYADLGRQIRERKVERRYLALVWGTLREDNLLIDIPVGRLARDPTRVAAARGPAEVRTPRPATTHVRTLERYRNMTTVEARLDTGRTHQIRVHMTHLGHPLVGDRTYGRRRARQAERALDDATRSLVRMLPGQALHAQGIAFRHPAGGREMGLSVPPPPQMAALLAHLRGRIL